MATLEEARERLKEARRSGRWCFSVALSREDMEVFWNEIRSPGINGWGMSVYPYKDNLVMCDFSFHEYDI